MGKSRRPKGLQSFTKDDTTIRPGDFVLVRAEKKTDAPYVAKVHSIQSAGNRGEVMVRFRWFYRPEDTTAGRQPFHGHDELFLSDDYDLESIDTIEGKCTVHDIESYTTLSSISPDDFFSRFEYKSKKKVFVPDPSNIPMYCKCKMPYNPDKFMIQCDKCSEWFHPDCININIEKEVILENFVGKDCNPENGRHEAPESPRLLDRQEAVLQNDYITESALAVSNSGEVSSKVCLIYDARMLSHKRPVGSKNPEKPGRISHIYKQLRKDDLLKCCEIYKCEEVKDQHLFAIHDKHYMELIEEISNLEEPDKAELDANYFAKENIYFSKGTATAVKLAAGGAVKACDLVAKGIHDKACAIIRPPGHHAKKSYADGFCFVNNAAVATNFLLDEHKLKKILILDWDVHHGNGTQEFFYENKNVLFFSLHRHSRNPKFYPYDKGGTRSIGIGEGKGFNINFCWVHDSIRDDDFITVWEYLLLPVAKEFAPEIVVISAGFDAALDDEVGGCSVTAEGYATLLKMIMKGTNGKVVLLLEGGYHENSTSGSVAACIKVLAGDMSQVRPDSQLCMPYSSTLKTIVTMRKMLRAQWSALREDIPQEIMDRHVVYKPQLEKEGK